MSSYLKRWRTRAAPRARSGAAGEEWEELGREASEEDTEEADAVVVAAASAAPPPPPAAAKAEASQQEAQSELELDDDDAHPFALLRMRIRPASAAFWVRTPLARRRLGHSPASRAQPRRARRASGRSALLLPRGSRRRLSTLRSTRAAVELAPAASARAADEASS